MAAWRGDVVVLRLAGLLGGLIAEVVAAFVAALVAPWVAALAFTVIAAGGALTVVSAATAATADSAAATGPRTVAITDFPQLIDATRSARTLPIKLFMPEGTDAVPVVILSHGGGGSRDANFAQAQHLASHGYAVLALEHPGSNTPRLLEGGRYLANLQAMTRDASEVLGRPRDVSFAIDRAAQWQAEAGPLQGRFDLDRVAVMGHSYGAYTALVACGARPMLDWLAPVVPPGHGLGPDLSDARVRACVALSPQGPGAPFFGEGSYASVRRPVLGISGSRDEQQGAPPENRKRFFELLPVLAPPAPAPAATSGATGALSLGHALVWLANADHTAFSDSSGSGRRGLPSTTRSEAQPITRAATLYFLNTQLRGQTEADAALSQAGLKGLLRGRVDAVEVLRK